MKFQNAVSGIIPDHMHVFAQINAKPEQGIFSWLNLYKDNYINSSVNLACRLCILSKVAHFSISNGICVHASVVLVNYN